MAGAQQQHAESGLADAAAHGLGEFPVQKHLVEGEGAAVITADGGELAAERRGVHPDAHGGDLKLALEHRVPHENVAVELPVVVIRGPSVVLDAGGKGLADLHQKHGVVLLTDGPLPLGGGEAGIAVLQLLGGDEVHVPAGPEGEDGIGVPQSRRGVADAAYDVPHGVFQIRDGAVLEGDVFFPVPLVHVDGVEIVQLLVPADGVHVGVESGALLELIPFQGQTLPLGQGVDHLTLGPHIGDVKGDGAFHTVEVVVQSGGAVHKQGGGDPVQVQPHGEIVLKIGVDQLNGPLELVVGQGHLVAGGNGEFAHVIRPVLYIDFRRSAKEGGHRRGDVGLHKRGGQQKRHQNRQQNLGGQRHARPQRTGALVFPAAAGQLPADVEPRAEG